MKIILFRHGEKQSKIDGSTNITLNRSICLTDNGIKQIESLAELIATQYPEFSNSKILHTSPFPRCVQSAEIVRSRLNIKMLQPVLELSELYAFSDYKRPREVRLNMTFDAILDIDKVNETGYSFRSKVKELLEWIIVQHKSGTELLLLSTHASLMTTLIIHLDPWLKGKVISETEPTQIPDASYILLEFIDKRFKLVETNIY